MSQLDRIPYTYLIGWTNHNKWYYGVRFAKGCAPNDLWIKYFTSSKVVKEFYSNYGNPDIIQIRKTFNTVDSARQWESNVLKKMNVINEDKWLNQTNNKATSLEASRKKRKPLSKEHKELLLNSRRGKKNSEEHKLALLQSRLGTKHSEEAKKKMSLAKSGKKHSLEYKRMCSERNIKRYSNPDSREVCSLRNKVRYQNPEARKKMSEASKLAWAKRKNSA